MLISSFHPSPTTIFDGYCFVGADYIAGARGAADYERQTGQNVEAGHDGCYTTAIQRSYGWELGTDAHGMGKLFTYQKGHIWAVASSLYEIAEHLRINGVNLRPSLHNLRALSIQTGLTQQPISRNTIIQDITLAAPNERIQVNASGIHTVKAVTGCIQESYENALSEFLVTWRSRLLTITQDERTTLSADLSGGMDSRVVFSFLASGRVDELGLNRFRLASNENRKDDYPAAKGVADYFGFTLNTAPTSRKSARSGRNAIDSWKKTCLGTYVPLYINNNDFDPHNFQAHGAGGENYRPYYVDGRGPGDLERLRGYFQSGEFEALKEEVGMELQNLTKEYPRLDPYIAHYRHFRNRMHFGHRPHRRPMFTPLNSILLDQVYNLASDREDRQIYFDIMESLAPGLKDLPYDSPGKAPTDANKEDITFLSVDSQIRTGRSYTEPLPDPVVERDNVSGYKLWMDEAAAAIEMPEVYEFMGPAAADSARNAIAEFRKTKRVLAANHKGVQNLSYGMAVRFAFAL